MKKLISKGLFLLGMVALFGACASEDNKPVRYKPQNWDGIKRGNVFYEIFVRSYADSNNDSIGDLKGITEKLDYLNQLGVSGIWLTPIYPSPSYHGYDVDDYIGINPQFGTMKDFEALVAKAHSLGIKVVLDFVMNHTSKEHPWFVAACSSPTAPERNEYLIEPTSQIKRQIESAKVPMTKVYSAFEWHPIDQGTKGYSYMGMFSPSMPDINYGPVDSCENSPMFRKMVDAALFWISKGVDGFRLDAVKHIYQDAHSEENPRFLDKFYHRLKQTKPDLYMIGEVLSPSEEVAPYYHGLPTLFDFSSWWKMSEAINTHKANQYAQLMLDNRKMYEAARPDFEQATKLSNHDEVRTRTVLQGSIEKSKLAAAILLTSIGSPYLYYGEELGMIGEQKAGDLGIREPFLWDSVKVDGFRPKWMKVDYSTDQTVAPLSVQQADNHSIYSLYKQLISLRNTYPALADGDLLIPEGADQLSESMMTYVRQKEDQRILVIHNVSDSTIVYTPREDFRVTPIGGNGEIINISKPQKGYSMGAYSSLILLQKK